jgi:hypothetical protein
MWCKVEPPMMMASPQARRMSEWCDTQRSATSAIVSPCAVTTARTAASASKNSGFQYLVKHMRG